MKPFELAPLPYSYSALEPYIDARTVEIHYTKHHATYLKNLNTSLEKYPEFFDQSIEYLLSNLDQLPEEIRTSVRGNGGGYYNHELYWENMAPGKGGEPTGKLAIEITRQFGSFTNFKIDFEKAGLTRLGSGYAWLSMDNNGKLKIHSTPNQDTPLAEGLTPILVCDVWEHAYYLLYQNRRADYLAGWWNLVNWNIAEQRYHKF